VALKDYYDTRRQARQAGVELPEQASTTLVTQTIPPVTSNKVYIAPLTNGLQPALAADYPYMQEAILDEYRQAYPNSVIAETPGTNWRDQAATANCRWIIVPQILSTRSKDQQNTYRITLQQTVYEASSGTVVDMQSFSTSTTTLTPLEAFIHAFKGFRSQEENWLRNSSGSTRVFLTQQVQL
jgi:hypothetical protein